MAKATKKKTEQAIMIPGISTKLMEIRLIGDQSLICHAWSQKAKKMILDKQQKKAKGAKEIRDPEQDYLDSMYPLPDGKGYGFPASAFKKAAVSACRNVDGIPMTLARGAFHILGDLVPIECKAGPEMREDMVRIGMGTADLRYRGEFKKWSVVITVRYNTKVMSAEQIVNLMNTAGFAVGVGERRPEKTGETFGMFHVATEKDK